MENDDRIENLSKRIDDLEQTVSNLKDEISLLRSVDEVERKPAVAPASIPEIDETPEEVTITDAGEVAVDLAEIEGETGENRFETMSKLLTSSEFWINKVGVALLLLGLVFLFKYSIDRGWITPAMRVLFGLVTGFTLLGIGVKVHEKRRLYSMLMEGAGIAALYISTFASFQIYHLVSHTIALTFMVAITILSFMASLWQKELSLSLVATIGGLLTPFLLFTGNADPAGLTIYTIAIATGSVAIYYFTGWRSVLWLAFIGSWQCLLIARSATHHGQTTESWVVQAGAIVAIILFWLVPTIREVRIPNVGSKLTANYFPLIWLNPLLLHGLTVSIWKLGEPASGGVATAIAIVWGVAAWLLTKDDWKDGASYVHTLVAVLFATFALAYFLDGKILIIGLAAEATMLRFVANRFDDRWLSTYSNVLFLTTLGLIIKLSFDTSPQEIPFFNQVSLTIIAAIALSFLAQTKIESVRLLRIYRYATHGLTLILLAHDLDMLNRGPGYAVALFATYAFLLFAFSDRFRDESSHKIVAHVIFAIAAYMALDNSAAASWHAQTAFFSLVGISNLLLIVLAALAAIKYFEEIKTRNPYLLLAHIGFLLYLYREMEILTGEPGAATAAWGVYAVALLIIGTLKAWPRLTQLALITLGLCVVKLGFFDLSRVDPLIRVILFMGFGAALLGVGYYLKPLWSGSHDDSE